jgi:hypothetical protein
MPLLGMATGESLACLNYLVHRGEAACTVGADGVAWFRLAQAGPKPTAGAGTA